MSHKLLPYLQCLRTTLTALSPALAQDPGLTMQNAIATKLLDKMIVEQSAALSLQTDCYVTLLASLPAIEQALGAEQQTAISELRILCTLADTDSFDRFNQLVGQVQLGLIALNTPPALALAKAIVTMETDYNRKFDIAVVAQAAAATAANTGASVVRNTREIDHAALLTFIRQNYPDETELNIEKSSFISGGFSKFTAGITLTNTKSLPEQIILRGDAGATFGGVSVVDEYRLIKTMYENGVCVPKPLAVDESGNAFGSPILLVERIPGTIIGHMFNLPGKPNKAIADDIAVKLATIHRVPLAAIGNQIDGANSRSSDKALAWIAEGLAAWKPLNMPSPVFETAFEWLRKNAELNDKVPRTLVHGDFGLNNLLIENDKVSTILDWEFAHIGNPAYDLGYFYFMAKSLGSWEDFLQAYGETGMTVPDADQLNYNILLAATRLGVMVAQTAAAFTSGAEPGLAGASVIGGGYYEETIKRVSGALQRVL